MIDHVACSPLGQGLLTMTDSRRSFYRQKLYHCLYHRMAPVRSCIHQSRFDKEQSSPADPNWYSAPIESVNPLAPYLRLHVVFRLH